MLRDARTPDPDERAMPAESGRAGPIGRRFEAFVFDWDGTAVPDRGADASELRELVEELCAFGAYVAVVSGTHLENVDAQLAARPAAPGRLVLALNRGSEVFGVDEAGPRLLHRRVATAAEDASLDAAADLAVRRLVERGLGAEIVSQRLNRRKIDLIPVPEWSDPPKARIAELLEAVQERLYGAGLGGLPEVVEIATAAAREAGLSDPRVTSDAKHVEIGLTDKSDSGRWIFDDLWSQGFAPSLVLVGGDEFGPLGGLPGSDSLVLVDGARAATAVSVGAEPEGLPEGVHGIGGGPAAFVALLRDQRDRRRAMEAPHVDDRPGWSVVVDRFDPQRERGVEALLTISDGWLATNGAPSLGHATAVPRTLIAGVYQGDGPATELLVAPDWHRLPVDVRDPGLLRRTLDLRAGLLREELVDDEELCSVRFLPLDAPGTAVLRGAHSDGTPDSAALTPPASGGTVETGQAGDRRWMRVPSSPGGIAAAAAERTVAGGNGMTRVDRFAGYAADPLEAPDVRDALARVDPLVERGFERLLVEHRARWASRWADSDVVVEGDDALQQGIRFALFHLHGAAREGGEAAVGARGLTGPAYRGHVFWDADIFVLPFLAATRPQAARAVLEYRVRRLPAARAAARAAGYEGARFPWESARSGRDVTPPSARDRAGRVLPIRTGQLEEHIVADVAWAAAWYADWTGDEEFAAGPGRALLVETARYWASRIRTEPDGSAHIFGVIGPDEYHQPVDDNSFTNVMARWNLRRAASAVGDDADPVERRRWLELADALVDGYDPESGVYEQFAGFHELEPLVIEEVAPRRPVSADLLLGYDRVEQAQVVKQADVLMAHHLVPDEMVAGSLDPNLHFYEPRTAHGSSLSPGIHAALFARARDDRHALEALRTAARIDLDDLTATTGGGLHLGALGSVWHALALGFAGMRPGRDGVLAVDPRLPSAWSAFEVNVVFRGRRVRLRKERGVATLWSDAPVRVRAGDCELEPTAGGTSLALRNSGWEVTT
jgi:trehalose/maltose hydrolase-like predicted phosphorylase